MKKKSLKNILIIKIMNAKCQLFNVKFIIIYISFSYLLSSVFVFFELFILL